MYAIPKTEEMDFPALQGLDFYDINADIMDFNAPPSTFMDNSSFVASNNFATLPLPGPIDFLAHNDNSAKKSKKTLGSHHAGVKEATVKRSKKVDADGNRIRQVRPKVVIEKGAVQCVGHNRKKGTQCRNAALMEYIGPKPAYCAEHIELDPASLYEKCKAGFQKEPGDKKNCKEVVLKEFSLCYKHYHLSLDKLVANGDLAAASHQLERVSILLRQLEMEAAAAKKKDGDLYQRKNKLIPKFQSMKNQAAKCVETLGGCVSPSISMPRASPPSTPTTAMFLSASMPTFVPQSCAPVTVPQPIVQQTMAHSVSSSWSDCMIPEQDGSDMSPHISHDSASSVDLFPEVEQFPISGGESSAFAEYFLDSQFM